MNPSDSTVPPTFSTPEKNLDRLDNLHIRSTSSKKTSLSLENVEPTITPRKKRGRPNKAAQEQERPEKKQEKASKIQDKKNTGKRLTGKDPSVSVIKAKLKPHQFTYLLENKIELQKLDYLRSYSQLDDDGVHTNILLRRLSDHKIKKRKWERDCLGDVQGVFQLLGGIVQNPDELNWEADPLRKAIFDAQNEEKPHSNSQVQTTQAHEDEYEGDEGDKGDEGDEGDGDEVEGFEGSEVDEPEDSDELEDYDEPEEETGTPDEFQILKTKQIEELPVILQTVHEVPIFAEEEKKGYEHVPFSDRSNEKLYAYEHLRNQQAQGQEAQVYEETGGYLPRVIRKNLQVPSKSVSQEEFEESRRKADALHDRKPGQKRKSRQVLTEKDFIQFKEEFGVEAFDSTIGYRKQREGKENDQNETN